MRPGKVTVKPSKSTRRRACSERALIRARHPYSTPAPTARAARIDPDKNWSGLISSHVPDRMPKSADVVPAPSASSSPRSIGTLGAESPWWKCCRRSCQSRSGDCRAGAQSFEKQGINILTDAQSHQAGKKERQRHRHHRKGSRSQHHRERVTRAVGSSGPTFENLGSKNSASNRTRHHCRRPIQQNQCTGIYAIGDVSGRRCWRTRPSMRASSASRRFKGLHPHPMNKLMIPGLHLLLAADSFRSGSPEPAAEGKEDRHRVAASFVGTQAIAWARSRVVKVIFDKKTGPYCSAPHMIGARSYRTDPGYVVAMNLETRNKS